MTETTNNTSTASQPSTHQPSNDDLRDWDIDRLLFYVGELEAQVARYAAEAAARDLSNDVVVTLTTEQAETVVGLLADNVDWLRQEGDEYADEAAERVAEIHDEIVAVVPKEV